MAVAGIVELFAGCLLLVAFSTALHLALGEERGAGERGGYGGEERSADWEWDRQRELSPWRAVGALVVPATLVLRSRRRRSLCASGQVAMFLSGIALTLASTIHMILTIAVFLAASRLTQFRQVVANAGPSVLASMFSLLTSGFGAHRALDFGAQEYAGTGLELAVAGGLAAVAGDTFASELGPVLSSSPARLLTSGRLVPRGTNGGVSLEGSVASLGGGLLVGVLHLALVLALTPAALDSQWPLVLVGGACGVLGSFLDSLLGATLQYSGLEERTGAVVEEPGPGVRHIAGLDVLDNDSVNLFSVGLTALVAPRLAFFLAPTSST